MGSQTGQLLILRQQHHCNESISLMIAGRTLWAGRDGETEGRDGGRDGEMEGGTEGETEAGRDGG